MNNLKESNVEWIGKIPENWDIIPLKYATTNVNEKNNPIKMTNILSLTNKDGVIPYEDKGNQGNISKDDLSQYKLAYKNTVIINSMNLKIGSVGLSNYDGCVSPVYYVLKNTEKSDIRFINYIFQSDFQKYLGKFGKGIMEIREKIPMYDVMHTYIPFPNIKEQQEIANYLDDKVSKIYKFINANNKEIELLKEYKKSIFKHIIGKYKTNTKKLKYLISKKMQYGANSSGVPYEEKLPRYIRITDIETNGLSNNDILSLNEEEANDFILNDGDILFARSGATVGKSFIYKEEYGKCAFAGYLIRAQFDNINLAEYVYNYTNSNIYDDWKNSIFIQSTIQNIGADKYAIMPIPIPSNQEQIESINKKIDNITKKIDKIIIYKQNLIDKLEEYKKSLIYEVVTGKKEI